MSDEKPNLEMEGGPTLLERYQHFRENAEIHVKNLLHSIERIEKEGNLDHAADLRVLALQPWEAVLRADNSGDLWPTCEVCGKPIKDDDDLIVGEDVDLHRSCLPEGPPEENEANAFAARGEESGLRNGFIAKGTSLMYRSVSITDAGLAMLDRNR